MPVSYFQPLVTLFIRGGLAIYLHGIAGRYLTYHIILGARTCAEVCISVRLLSSDFPQPARSIALIKQMMIVSNDFRIIAHLSIPPITAIIFVYVSAGYFYFKHSDKCRAVSHIMFRILIFQLFYMVIPFKG